MAAKKDLVAIAFCQSDPMAVLLEETEPCAFNPISFAAPTAPDDRDRCIRYGFHNKSRAWARFWTNVPETDIPDDTWAVDEKVGR